MEVNGSQVSWRWLRIVVTVWRFSTPKTRDPSASSSGCLYFTSEWRFIDKLHWSFRASGTRTSLPWCQTNTLPSEVSATGQREHVIKSSSSLSSSFVVFLVFICQDEQPVAVCAACRMEAGEEEFLCSDLFLRVEKAARLIYFNLNGSRSPVKKKKVHISLKLIYVWGNRRSWAGLTCFRYVSAFTGAFSTWKDSGEHFPSSPDHPSSSWEEMDQRRRLLFLRDFKSIPERTDDFKHLQHKNESRKHLEQLDSEIKQLEKEQFHSRSAGLHKTHTEERNQYDISNS